MDEASATDNCGEVVITVETVTTDGACAGDYVITRTFTATDDCGNATSATQTITIIDTTAPEFYVSHLITQRNVLTHILWMRLQLLITVGGCDYCLRQLLLMELVLVITLSLVRSLLRMIVVTRQVATQTITIIDTTAPSLIAPGNLKVGSRRLAPNDPRSTYIK